MARFIALGGDGTFLTEARRLRDGIVRPVAGVAVALLAMAGLAQAAQAQANIHNGGVTLNTAQNSSSSASGTLTNRGSDTAAGTLPYNSARFNFDYSVASTGNWAGGIQYQTQGGKPMIWAYFSSWSTAAIPI